ncbi:hypothetical protein ACWEQL_17400 [Kitasatospora sp. NPDC004240]
MIDPSPRPLTLEAAGELQALLDAEIGPGLGAAELDAVEARFGFRFSADHRVFLSAGLPHGSRSWPDWRHGDPDDLRARLAWPVEGVLFDVGHNGFWYPGWGPEPAERADRLRIAEAALVNVPQLVPVHGHRYLPAADGAEDFQGHPVLSVHQTDIISYGDDLADHVRTEFTVRSATGSRPRATVGFWSYIVEGCPEGAFTTPHDPYGVTTAEQSCEHGQARSDG